MFEIERTGFGDDPLPLRRNATANLTQI